MNFSWSDNNPTPKQEAVSLRAFQQVDFQDPLIASAEYKSSAQLGPSGQKEGPYDWVPPSYWYDITHFDPTDPTRTNVGGAWAFDSEASAGHTVPTLDSIRRFLSPFEQDELWQNPDYNQYHANYESDLPNPQTNGGYSVRDPARPRRRDQPPLRPLVQPRSVCGGGSGPELRDPASGV
jgi:exo-1,4-beta-D-glucosaminidase